MVSGGYYKNCSEMLQILPYNAQERPRKVYPHGTNTTNNGGTRQMKHQDLSDNVKRWDAGQGGCGRLVVELRQQLEPLHGGELLEVTARDAGAPADLPAWCRVTGHELVSAAHPVYAIRKRNG